MEIKVGIKASEILPKKEGKRVLIYPCNGVDFDWIHFLNPDVTLGIDITQPKEWPTDWSKITELILEERDAAYPPQIPRADEVVLLLRGFSLIRIPPSQERNKKNWEEYREKNLTCLRNYLKACEISSSKGVYVIDVNGYEEAIVPLGYRKILTELHHKKCGRPYKHCKSPIPLCSKAPAFWTFEERTNKRTMHTYNCKRSTPTLLLYDNGSVYAKVSALIAYVKEKS